MDLPAPLWRALRIAAVRGICVRHAPPAALATANLRGLVHLSSLTLSHCGLAEVPALDGCANIVALDVSHNALSAPPSCAWSLPHLRIVDLSHNRLVTLGAPPDTSPALASLHYVDLSHNRLGEFPAEIAERLACVRVLRLGANKLARIPHALLDLELRCLECLELDNNPTPPDVLIGAARLAGGVYVAIEMCDAPRPSFTLKGSAERYRAALAEVHRAIAAAHPALPVLVNPGPAETVADYPAAEHDELRQDARYPRVGALEAIVRTDAGAFVTLHSKVVSGRWPSAAAIVARLDRFMTGRGAAAPAPAIGERAR